jgi:hypothetical protein
VRSGDDADGGDRRQEFLPIGGETGEEGHCLILDAGIVSPVVMPSDDEISCRDLLVCLFGVLVERCLHELS